MNGSQHSYFYFVVLFIRLKSYLTMRICPKRGTPLLQLASTKSLPLPLRHTFWAKMGSNPSMNGKASMSFSDGLIWWSSIHHCFGWPKWFYTVLARSPYCSETCTSPSRTNILCDYLQSIGLWWACPLLQTPCHKCGSLGLSLCLTESIDQ